MDHHTRERLISHLSGYITPQRFTKMQQVLNERTRHLCVVMEDIYQPHNASAVLRSCDCFGIQDVHIIENRNAYRVNPDVALGASQWLNLVKYNEKENNTAECLQKLKSEGYRLVATSPHDEDCLLEELPVGQKTALLFGTELKGLSEEALEMADAYTKISMSGFTESLNISVSAAICLYHLAPRVRSNGIPWQLSQEERSQVLLDWIKSSLKSPDAMIKRYLEEHGE